MSDDDHGEAYANVRDKAMLGPIIGCRVVDVTQHDAEEWEENRESRIYLHFDNGYTVSFPIGDAGWDITTP